VPLVRVVAFRKNQVGNFCLPFQVLTSLSVKCERAIVSLTKLSRLDLWEGTLWRSVLWRLASPWIPRRRRRDRVRRPASCDCVRRRNSLERWDKRCKWHDTTAVSSWRQPGEQQQQQKPPHRWHPPVHLIYTSRCEPLMRSRNFVWRSLRWRSSMIAYWMQRML